MSDNLYHIPSSLESSYDPFRLPSTLHKIVVLSDLHVPYHNFAAINTVFDFCQKINADSVLLNGDFMDCYQLSKFSKDPRKRSFKAEIDTANEMLDSIQMAFPRTKKYFKKGNHEERLDKYLQMKAAELLSIPEFDFEFQLRLPARGIGYITDQRIIWAGKLPILHGHEVGIKSVVVNPARSLYLKVKGSALCSHLHVASQHSAKRLDGYVIGTWSTGHLSEEHPEYARNNEWTLGFAVVDFDSEYFEVSNYKIIHNKVYRT